ncbi:MAG: SLBB domain-containing protein [Bradyrhizobiaceae bacterium]|nr:SLBB domain-containing protein [Bradyrhizobiaceae bacterium]
MSKRAFGIWLGILLFATTSSVMAQNNSFTRPRFIPKGPYDYDTTGSKEGVEIARKSTGLLTREINPAEYVVGAGDELLVSVYTTNPLSLRLVVSPEGKLVFPQAGVLLVKGLTLDSVQALVAREARRIYRDVLVDVSLANIRQFKVYVLGAVAVPSTVPATVVDHVFDVLERAGGILDTGSVRGILLVREGEKEPIKVDLQRYMSYGDNTANPTVRGGDRIIVPLRNNRDVISVSGEVPVQRTYQFVEGDSISTLVRMAGGFLASARLDSVTLVRLSEQSDKLEEQNIDMTAWRDQLLTGVPLPGDMPLRSGDRLYIRAVPKWNERAEVVVRGEVRFPGRYAIIRDKTRLSEVINMAGGFTADASLADAVVIRVSEMKIEDKEYERLKRLPPSEMSDGELQYYRTKSREVKGVMAVSFTDLFLKKMYNNDPVMRDEDSVMVPPATNYINVTGSVRTPGRIVYKPELKYTDYINLAGGYGFRAEEDATLIIKTKGDQFPASSENYTLEPGDNILVLDEPETKFIDVFTKVLTIATQLVTVAGVVYTIVRLR